ncbi:uncharacterized protein LOC110986942 isoform X2 [Acanthaster planci]|uniref:Uncharacterized protein LOC110986942 isoform X2 n=1 Tax=Acanthaster planci TaxID=133434 RepID=A0A8B7ZIZ4_ACAPL|nr:uncharacterized protein LOC110986942 isoform X2 [Acanthaster planci]
MLPGEKHSGLRLLTAVLLISRITSSTLFLERGSRGVIPCPPVTSGQLPLHEITAQYWYVTRVQDGNLLISSFRGRVAPQNSIPEGVYDIDRNFSLVIENVTDSDEGIYFYKAKPRLRMVVDGHVTVAVKVSPKEPFPEVTECTRGAPKSECKAVFSHDVMKPRLTCSVRNVKPAVVLRWFLVYSDGGIELLSDRFDVEQSEVLENTFTTSTSLPLSSTKVNDKKFRCEAYGEALGATNGSRVTATVMEYPVLQTTPHLTSLQTTTAVMREAMGLISATTDKPDSIANALIAVTVTAALSITVNIFLAMAICKIKSTRRKNETKSKKDAQKFAENEEFNGRCADTSQDCEAVRPLNGTREESV